VAAHKASGGLAGALAIDLACFFVLRTGRVHIRVSTHRDCAESDLYCLSASPRSFLSVYARCWYLDRAALRSAEAGGPGAASVPLYTHVPSVVRVKKSEKLVNYYYNIINLRFIVLLRPS
jgi:hypothetical protein